GGAARRIRIRRRSAPLRLRPVPWLHACFARLCSGQCPISPPVGQSMQRTLSPRWLKPYWSGMAWGGGECEACHRRGGQFAAPLEELAELLADLAAARLTFFPLVGVDAQGGVGLS